jgi:hypothetical protein
MYYLTFLFTKLNQFFMNKEQSKQFGMIISTQNFLDMNTQTWNTIPRMVTYKNQFDELIMRIGDKAKETMQTVSVTERKKALQESLSVKAAALSGAMQILAQENNNPDLLNKVKLNRSDVLLMKEANVAPAISTLMVEAAATQEQLAEFGISEAFLTEVATTLDEFNTLMGKPRIMLNKTYQSISDLDKLIDEAKRLLNNKLDKLMLIYKETNPSFFEGYHRARTIVD